MPSENGTVNYEMIKAMQGHTDIYSIEEEKIIDDFSKLIVSTKRGLWGNPTKSIRDHTNGKLCELVVSKMLEPLGCSHIDMTNKPNWVDLKLPPFKIHVKSWEKIPSNKYQGSVTFQHEVGRKDDLFKEGHPGCGTEKDIIICCEVTRYTRTVVVKSIESWPVVKPLCKFTDGVDLPYYKGKKLFYHPQL